MNRNIIETVLGAVVLLVAAVFLGFAASSTDATGGKEGYKVNADFNRIDGLKVGSDVRMNGVMVGNVTAIELNKESFRARVTFTVDPKIKLPRDTNAAIMNESLLGGKYIALDVGVDEETIATDGKGKLTRTTPPMILDNLIGQLIYKEDKKKDDAPASGTPAPEQKPEGAL